MTFVFQFMLMLVSLYGLKMSPAGAVPVPPELEPLDEPLLEPLDEPLDEPLLEPLDEPLLEPLDEPLLDEPLPPPGQVEPPGSQPVPQLVVAQWYPCDSFVEVQPHDSPMLPSQAFAFEPM
jgi:hypothetical protein